MKSFYPVAIAVILVLGRDAAAQDLSRYRDYVLQSSVDSVAAAGGARPVDTATLHQRSAAIQELRWRAPYVYDAAKPADPVREIGFTFFQDALYQIVVHYDRDRTEGLTNSDILDALSKTYGTPILAAEQSPATQPPEASADTVTLARWENADSLVTLVRGSYTPEFRLIVVSKPLSVRATSAIREAARLHALEAPQREAAQRKTDADDARTALDKKRNSNKATFRP